MSLFQRMFRYSRSHVSLFVIAAIVLGGGGYWAYTTFGATTSSVRYVLGKVEKRTIVATVSASGQVSASSDLDIKPKVSGQLISVNVVAGQKVGAGDVIAVVDATNAQKNVRDAEVSVQSAELSLRKLQEPTDSLSLIQSENALAKATSDLAKSYDDGFNDVASTYLDLPGVMDSLKNILYGLDVSSSKSQNNISAYADMADSTDKTVIAFKEDAGVKYQKAVDAYNASFLKYRALSRSSSADAISALISDTYDTAKAIADAQKSANDFLGVVKGKLTDKNSQIPSLLTTHITSLGTSIATVNSHLLTLLSIKNSITSSQYSIAEKTQSLADLKAGTKPTDLEAARLTLEQRKNALSDAREALNDYYIRAPFAGTIASLTAKKYDTAGSGSSIATLITAKQMAELSLNEVDAAKIAVGDKATITFDAVEGLTLTGKVSEINAIGAVSQGVVSYTVKVSFDAQDARIKPGMTANASIQSAVRQDVLSVPVSAVKTKGDASTVQVFDPALPDETNSKGVATTRVPSSVDVKTGISDDAYIEITSGLAFDQQIVVRTVTDAKTTSSTGASSRGAMGGPGLRL